MHPLGIALELLVFPIFDFSSDRFLLSAIFPHFHFCSNSFLHPRIFPHAHFCFFSFLRMILCQFSHKLKQI